MPSRELITNSQAQSEIDFAGEAAQLLRDWSAQVSELPQLLSTDLRKRAVGALVRWYEALPRMRRIPPILRSRGSTL
jgi:hypothetical protein